MALDTDIGSAHKNRRPNRRQRGLWRRRHTAKDAAARLDVVLGVQGESKRAQLWT
jgi:hypothetical protein